jgi:hypothetical protein
MASDVASVPVNGAYASATGQNYGPTEQNMAVHNATTASATGAGNEVLSKEEVGWYFVERYYTTLSKTPEKLFVSFAVLGHALESIQLMHN